MSVKKLLTELKPGDVILWPWHKDSKSRHRSGEVVKVTLPDRTLYPNCVIADVLCTGDKFSAGIGAIYDVYVFEPEDKNQMTFQFAGRCR